MKMMGGRRKYIGKKLVYFAVTKMEEQELFNAIVENVSKVIIGKEKEITQILKGIVAGGHVLIEDVPGVGKTTLVKALAKSLDLQYKRIQFTPDLLPSDITGVSIYNKEKGSFEFKKGPIFSNIILADEINRTSPKTQSALLEVMEEYQVSEGNETYKLERPFVVLATENPIEYGGTFLLPEAQLDRFIMKVSIGYADVQNESKVLQVYQKNNPLDEIEPICSMKDLLLAQEHVKDIKASVPITDYIVALVNATRENKYITLGGSTRAALSLLRVSQATAMFYNREYVIPEYVRENFVSVLSHRIGLSPIAKSSRLTAEDVLNEIVNKTPIPRGYIDD